MTVDFDFLVQKTQEIADHYGLRHQLVKTVEELNELPLECAKSYRDGSITVNLINEIADVLVMIYQLIHLGQIEWKDVLEVMKFKVDRQLGRIDETEEEKMKEKIKENKMKVFDLSNSNVDYETLMTMLSENEQEYVLCGESEEDIAEGKAHVEVYDKSCVISRVSKADEETNPEWAGDRFGQHYYDTGNELYYCIAFCNKEEATAYLLKNEDN